MQKKKVYFVVNKVLDFLENREAKSIVNEFSCTVSEHFPESPDNYDLVVLWNFHKILKKISNYNNVIVCHSSDLPEGKGWAPIYNTILLNKDEYVISCIRANDNVDSGNILGQARFKMKASYTARKLREWDTQISLMLIKQILEIGLENIHQVKQIGKESFYPRRCPTDNEINIEKSFKDNILNIIASEINRSPSYFYYKGIKFLIDIYPEKEPEFPNDLKIVVNKLNFLGKL